MTSLPAIAWTRSSSVSTCSKRRWRPGPTPEAYVKLASEYAELQEMVGEDPRACAPPSGERDDLGRCSLTRRPIADMRDAGRGGTAGDRGADRGAARSDIQILLLPKDAADERNAILEIRAGTGGDEAALFAGDLFRMYERYAASQGLEGRGRLGQRRRGRRLQGNHRDRFRARACSRMLKFESGVHRVQRVPETEASGRIHTSAATVAVLPEAEEVDIEIRPEDIRIDTMRASGAGGQHVNTTDSAVRITHLPTGIMVVAGGEVAAPEPRARRCRSCARGSTTWSAARLADERSRVAQAAGRLGRSLRAHPHLQFSAGPA